jgi:hypothetical protein
MTAAGRMTSAQAGLATEKTSVSHCKEILQLHEYKLEYNTFPIMRDNISKLLC